MDNEAENEEILIAALKTLFDILVVFGAGEAEWEALLTSFMVRFALEKWWFAFVF